jgi:hypothetical protein
MVCFSLRLYVLHEFDTDTVSRACGEAEGVGEGGSGAKQLVVRQGGNYQYGSNIVVQGQMERLKCLGVLS